MIKKTIIASFFAMLLTSCGESLPENYVPVANADFNTEAEGWERVEFHNAAKSEIKWLSDGGVDNSGCVQITSLPENGRASVGVSQKLSGLEPNKMYRFRASLKSAGVKDGRGAVLFDRSTRQYWNASKFVKGDNDWQEVFVDFYSDDNGSAEIVCGLGFRLGGTTNGGFATGTVWYDNASVEKITPENYCYVEGEHFTLCAEQDHATLEVAQARVKGLDQIYNALVEFVGAAPYKGKKLVALGTEGLEAGYWALAGNPILLKHGSIGGVINSEDIGFGLVHEMGHVFNGGGNFEDQKFTSAWNWNDELFANFRAYVAIKNTNSLCSFNGHMFKGEELKNFYKSSHPNGKKLCYDNTLGAGKSTSTGDAYTYIFIRLGDELGWDNFKKGFNDLYKNGKGPFKNNWDRFDYILTTLQKYSDKDVRATFPKGELDLIKEGLGGNK